MAIDRFSFGVQWVPIGTKRSANARPRGEDGGCGENGKKNREEREAEEKEKRMMRAKWKYCLAARRLSFLPSRHLTLHPSADNPPPTAPTLSFLFRPVAAGRISSLNLPIYSPITQFVLNSFAASLRRSRRSS